MRGRQARQLLEVLLLKCQVVRSWAEQLVKRVDVRAAVAGRAESKVVVRSSSFLLADI